MFYHVLTCSVYHYQPNCGKLHTWKERLETVIKIENVSVKKQEKHLLHNINWQTEKGEHWVLLGANGAGKTTLLQVILGYLWPTSGQVRVLGKVFGEYDLRELRKKIGFVSVQMDVRLEGGETALDLVVSGKTASYRLYEAPDPADRQLATHYLQTLGATPIAGKPYHLLSQGERQKVLIARALMANPELLVLDEPCNGLDFPSREQLLFAISSMTENRDRQLIYVTHYPEEITSGFTHVALLKNGEMVAAGKKHDVLTDEVLTTAYDVPVHVEWFDERPVIRMVQK